jgi:hypothetical protein
MKKGILWGILLAVLVSCNVYAQGFAVGGVKIKVYGCVSNYASGLQNQTTVPTTVIPAGSRIVGLAITDLSAGASTECFVSIADIVNTEDGSIAEIIAENETPAGGGSEWFNYPVTVTTQVTIHQGSHTAVLVYYI